jgi:hypothetical protein
MRYLLRTTQQSVIVVVTITVGPKDVCRKKFIKRHAGNTCQEIDGGGRLISKRAC